MKPERWEQVAQLHRAALRREASERPAFLREACAGDEDLCREVESLLAYDEKKASFMESPALEDDRLLKEVFYFADRSDISEELTRLESHFQQFDDCVKSQEPVGRTLDFLAQEINREINTLGAKANDSLISRDVVVLKAELEKFREQVQNVE